MRVMEMPECKPGYWYVNIAPFGEQPKWEQQVMPPEPDDKIFGYEMKEFLRKQYK